MSQFGGGQSGSEGLSSTPRAPKKKGLNLDPTPPSPAEPFRPDGGLIPALLKRAVGSRDLKVRPLVCLRSVCLQRMTDGLEAISHNVSNTQDAAAASTFIPE